MISPEELRIRSFEKHSIRIDTYDPVVVSALLADEVIQASISRIDAEHTKWLESTRQAHIEHAQAVRKAASDFFILQQELPLSHSSSLRYIKRGIVVIYAVLAIICALLIYILLTLHDGRQDARGAGITEAGAARIHSVRKEGRG